MNEEEIWETARKPVDDFVGAISDLRSKVDKLVKFYLKHTPSASRGSYQFSSTVANIAHIKQNPKSSEDATANEQQSPGEELSPLASAKLELAIVFAINTCYWLYLVTNGEDPTKNVISKDLERIRLFMKRASEVDASFSEAGPCAKKVKIEANDDRS